MELHRLAHTESAPSGVLAPGIADLRLAMTDGWTSGSGLGLGLTGLVGGFAVR